ncbi:bromodomain-containing protein 8 [Zerene cesonia]|uniref:bromodomain-containing protein 8 n=1 Tax=Zerene cesonia TaxID=33412 RepID=UPI0018E583CA|nr:bromodomain-containing protein 8 [Zerene cesonia]
MSSIQERLQLKRVPLDTWNVREQLCLASAVVRSGDQNWMSVSRALKTIGEPNRPADWYSQKSCAAQYGALLEHVETPKRKKRNSEGGVETPQECILKRLTEQRIHEIQSSIAEMNQQYEQLKNEISEVRNASTPEERLHELWSGIEAAKRAREKESARRAAWLKERDEKRARAERTWRPSAQPPAAAASSTPSSPLLSSLLKSTPVVTTPQHITHPANVVDAISPSAGAPTLSLLLEQPHENKHAAIEHIKSQLVQIEHQLKAFRDIDINIPPVTTMHKASPRVEKQFKKEDEQTDEPAPTIPEDIKMETDATEPIVEPDTLETADVEMTEEVQVEQPAEVEETPPAPPAEAEVKVSFPEVKFPTPEIKVIQPEGQKVKEEIQPKEPEIPPEEEMVEVVEEEKEKEMAVVNEEPPVKEEIVEESQSEPLVEEGQHQEDEPPEVAALDVMELQPEDIPLPPEDPPAVPEPVKEPTPPPEVKEEKQEIVEEKRETEEQSGEEKVSEDDRKDEDAEDSIPLKEMIKEESLAQEKKEEDTHTETDDDTPMELSREEEKDGKKKRDYSRKKKSDSRTCSGSESAPESPSSSEAERQHRLWRKSVMLVYGRLCAHKYASLFLRPITDEEAPGYSSLIKRPMDLSTIRRNIDSGVIRTTAQFQRDVLLMLSNALIYNSSSHSVYTMAKEMFEEAHAQLGMLVAAQAHAGLVACAPPARKRRPLEPAHKPPRA